MMRHRSGRCLSAWSMCRVSGSLTALLSPICESDSAVGEGYVVPGGSCFVPFLFQEGLLGSKGPSGPEGPFKSPARRAFLEPKRSETGSSGNEIYFSEAG